MVVFKKVNASDLFVSEPNPRWFGNPGNEKKSSWTNENWLKSRFHFSFAEWRSGRPCYGCLRVVNDDLVQPARGFGRHGHSNMEIVTYVLNGELTHRDSMGTEETLGRGSIQFMTAGTGVQHEEHNLNKSKPLRFIQTWILPRKVNLTPVYGSMDAAKEPNLESKRINTWLHLVGDVENTDSKPKIKVNQDINLYVSEIEESKSLSIEISKGRQAYLVCVEGSVSLNENTTLEKHEACEIRADGELKIVGKSTKERAHVMLFEMQRA